MWLFYGYKGKNISKVVDGIRYKTPVILSAGFDHNGYLTRILPSLGFGGVEVGSITARPYAGNSRPNLIRLPKTKALIVNKGLKNEGVEAVIKRLKETPREKDFVIGISIAKTNDMKSVSTAEAILDYCYSFKRLNEENIGDYYTINISCPNAFGGETFTAPELLNMLLGELGKTACQKPVYIKMPINLSWAATHELLEVIVSRKISGVIFGNLNKDYNYIEKTERPEKYIGGISGQPCFDLSNELTKKTSEKYGDKLTVIGCGGIFTPEDAMYKFEIGSQLIHMITGMIYSGPGIIKNICKEYSKKY